MALALLSGLLYFLAVTSGLALRVSDSAIPVLWPQSATLVALLMLTRPGRWWVVAIAAVPAHFAAHWNFGLSWWQLAWQVTHGVVLALGIVATLRLLIGARDPFASSRDFSLYAVVAVVVGPAAFGSLSPLTWLAFFTGDLDHARATWQAECLANSLAMLALTPFLYSLLLTGPSWLRNRTPMQYAELLVIATVLLAAYYLIFIGRAELHTPLYLLFIPLLWLAARFGVGGAASAIACVAMLAAASGDVPHSVLLRAEPENIIIDLQIFLIVIALTALVVAVITEERRRAAQAMRESDARYRAIIETQTELVWRSLPDTTLTFVNEALCRYFGRTREQLVGIKWIQFVPAETREGLEQALAHATPRNPTFTLEHEVLLPDGRTGWHQWINTSIFAADQGLIELQGIGRDITELKRAEFALRQSDERLRLVLRATYDVIYDWDIRRGELWSSTGSEWNGDEWSDAIPNAQPWSLDYWGRYVHHGDRERVVQDCRQALEGTAESWEGEYRYARLGGPMRWVRERACILRDANGVAVRMIGALTDLSDRKKLEEANRSLARLARLATVGEITASIAHEINQPLSAILHNAEAGLLFLARKRYDRNEIREILDDIRRDNRRASELIRRLRELLQDHELRHDPVNINQLVTEVVKLVRIESRRYRTQLVTQCADLPTILGDYGRLQQVLINLVLNSMDAMGALPESRRRIAIRTTCIGATRIQVTVIDSGCGIDPENLPKIFDSFFTSKEHGMGLGLAIARSIVEAHGGRIWAENNADGMGATLAFEIGGIGAEALISRPNATARYAARLN